jgi:SAM-dependent methyltransferase
MPKQQGLYSYEDRYKRVFAAGALHWNDPTPNPALCRPLEQLPEHSNCIEFGCGEGYQACLMASRGHSVTAIDLSPTAIARAIRETSSDCPVNFLVGDVTDASPMCLSVASYDLAVDIGCLHMMTEDEDRASYFDLVRNVLRPGGKFFLQEGLDADGEKPGPGGDLMPRTIMTAGGLREVLLPLLLCRFLSLEGYVGELTRHGFSVLSAERKGGTNATYEGVVVAENP